MMLNNIYWLIVYYVQSGIFPYIFYALFAIAFLATVPCIIRSFFRR